MFTDHINPSSTAQDKYRDPAQRLQKLQQVVEQRPALRPQDVARLPQHGRAVPMLHGSLRGPPSRPSADGGGATPGAANSAGGAGGGGLRPLRNLNSADGILSSVAVGLAGASGSGSNSPVCSLPALINRSNSHGSAASAPLALAAAASGVGGSGAAAAAALLRGGASYGGGGDDEERMSVKSFNSAGAGLSGGGAGGAGAGGRAHSTLPFLHANHHQQQQVPPPGRVLPALANNWVTSPAQTPPGHGGGGAGAGRGMLQVTAAPAVVARPGRGAPRK